MCGRPRSHNQTQQGCTRGVGLSGELASPTRSPAPSTRNKKAEKGHYVVSVMSIKDSTRVCTHTPQCSFIDNSCAPNTLSSTVLRLSTSASWPLFGPCPKFSKSFSSLQMLSSLLSSALNYSTGSLIITTSIALPIFQILFWAPRPESPALIEYTKPLIDEKTEMQRGQMTFPESPSNKCYSWVELGRVVPPTLYP